MRIVRVTAMIVPALAVIVIRSGLPVTTSSFL
jgi:hypothetical protein